MSPLIAAFILAYLIGSFPTAYLVGKCAKGIDIRQHGSGNVGATNVFRVVGKGWGLGVLLFDGFKGFFVAHFLPQVFAATLLSPFVFSLGLGVSAIVGHTWTVWLGFTGGKGVATSAGVFLALALPASGMALFVWILVFVWKRYVSLASLLTAATFPLWVWCFYRRSETLTVLFPMSLLLALFIGYTHRENIRRLRQGTEKRLI